MHHWCVAVTVGYIDVDIRKKLCTQRRLDQCAWFDQHLSTTTCSTGMILSKVLIEHVCSRIKVCINMVFLRGGISNMLPKLLGVRSEDMLPQEEYSVACTNLIVSVCCIAVQCNLNYPDSFGHNADPGIPDKWNCLDNWKCLLFSPELWYLAFKRYLYSMIMISSIHISTLVSQFWPR